MCNQGFVIRALLDLQNALVIREDQGGSGRVRKDQGKTGRIREDQGGSGRIRENQGESGRIREDQGLGVSWDEGSGSRWGSCIVYHVSRGYLLISN